MYWAYQKNLVKGCRQTLHYYCISCKLLSASIADALLLLFVNMVCLPLIAEQNAHEICLTQECLQIVRRLLWKQTTTHSIRNKNAMFEQQPLSQFKGPSQYYSPSVWPHVALNWIANNTHRNRPSSTIEAIINMFSRY